MYHVSRSTVNINVSLHIGGLGLIGVISPIAIEFSSNPEGSVAHTYLAKGEHAHDYHSLNYLVSNSSVPNRHKIIEWSIEDAVND